MRLAVCGLLLLSLAPSCFAADYDIIRSTFLPTVFYVGDRVEARILLRSNVDEAPRAPEELPSPSWGTVYDLRLSRLGRDYELRLLFSPFEPGTQVFPPIDLGSLVVLDVRVHVASILEEDRVDLAPPRPQVLLPGTRILVAAVLAVLFLVPILFILFFRGLRKWILGTIRRRRARRPYRRIKRSLKGLAVQASTLDGRSFYIVLLDEIRRYLTDKTGRDWLSATAAEVGLRLPAFVAEGQAREALAEIFLFGDLVKFGGKPSPLATRLAHVDRVSAIVDAMEGVVEASRVGR